MKKEKEFTKQELRNAGYRGIFAGAILTGIVVFLGYLSGTSTLKEKQDFVIKDFRAYDINKDRMVDLVGKEGNIYLQTKEGNFILYEEAIQNERTKLDSTYQVKQDSLNEIYENKLEKEVQ